MRLLLDTHVLFWFLIDDPKYTARHRKCVEEDAETTFVSAVTGWEIGIKVRLGEWPEAAVLLPGLTDKILSEGFRVLPLTLAQAERAGGLPLHHKDPFDRMIAAQALDLDLTVVASDRAIASFGCKVV